MTNLFDHEIVSIVVIVLTLLIFRHFVLCTSCLQYYSIPFVHIMSTIHSDQILINGHIMSTILLNTICAHNVYNTFRSIQIKFWSMWTSWLQCIQINSDQILINVDIMSTIHSDQFRSNSDQCEHNVYNTYILIKFWSMCTSSVT